MKSYILAAKRGGRSFPVNSGLLAFLTQKSKVHRCQFPVELISSNVSSFETHTPDSKPSLNLVLELYLKFIEININIARGKNVFAMRGKAQGNENELKCMNIRHYEKLITTITTRFWCGITNS